MATQQYDRLPPATEQALGALLVQDGLLSAVQLMAVQQYGLEQNLDLRQAILKLKLVSEERLQGLILEQVPLVQPSANRAILRPEANGPAPSLPAPAGSPPPSEAERLEGAGADPAGAPVPAPRASQPPDLAQRERDIRKELKEIAATAASPDLVAQIFDRAFESRATDIHFDPQESFFRIRYRIDGQLHDVLELEPAFATSMVSRIKVMAEMNIVERRHSQDGRIRYRIDGQLHDVLELEPAFASSMVSRIKVMADMNIVERRHSQDGRIRYRYRDQPRDLRVATLPTVLGEKIVVRIHEAMTEAYGFDLLGMEPAQSEQLSNICSKPYGAILVAGPVGAGKTTTLYTCLSRVNSPSRNVMTIEDPIERRLPGVNQLQVDTRIELTFGSGLKAMLRQDPDVIMIGEIRDDETAHIGIRAALTGVLVLSTIHAADAPSTLGNLYDFKIPGYMLSNTLLAVISQRLLRKICPYCKVSFEADEQQLAMLGLDPAERAGTMFCRGEGCAACFQTGYLGRSGIFEILEVNDTIRELIFQQIAKDVLRRVASDMGMRTLRQAAVDKVLEGATTLEEVYRVVSM